MLLGIFFLYRPDVKQARKGLGSKETFPYIWPLRSGLCQKKLVKNFDFRRHVPVTDMLSLWSRGRT
jgi:hypothetical protein